MTVTLIYKNGLYVQNKANLYGLNTAILVYDVVNNVILNYI